VRQGQASRDRSEIDLEPVPKVQFAKSRSDKELERLAGIELTLALLCSQAKLFPLPTGPAELPHSRAIVLKPRSAVQVTNHERRDSAAGGTPNDRTDTYARHCEAGQNVFAE
jgi:hypothetical protein